MAIWGQELSLPAIGAGIVLKVYSANTEGLLCTLPGAWGKDC